MIHATNSCDQNCRWAVIEVSKLDSCTFNHIGGYLTGHDNEPNGRIWQSMDVNLSFHMCVLVWLSILTVSPPEILVDNQGATRRWVSSAWVAPFGTTNFQSWDCSCVICFHAWCFWSVLLEQSHLWKKIDKAKTHSWLHLGSETQASQPRTLTKEWQNPICEKRLCIYKVPLQTSLFEASPLVKPGTSATPFDTPSTRLY